MEKKMIEEISDQLIKQDILKNKKTVLIYVWAPLCAKSKKMTSVVEEVAKENNNEIIFFKLNAEQNKEALKTYKVPKTPTTLIFSHGILVERRAGIRAKHILARKIKTLKSFTMDDAKNHEIIGFSTGKLNRNQYNSLWV